MKKHYEAAKSSGKEGNGAASAQAAETQPLKVRVMLVREGPAEKANIGSPEDAFKLLRREVTGLDREQLWRIDLDARHNVLGYEVVSVGTATASLVHPREIFKGAILNSAVGIVLAHNHPSQDTSPSPEDREVTRRVSRAGELLGIPLVDHLVLSDEKFYSFKQSCQL